MTYKEAAAATGRSVSWLQRHECAWCGQSLLKAVMGHCGAMHERCTAEQKIAAITTSLSGEKGKKK